MKISSKRTLIFIVLLSMMMSLIPMSAYAAGNVTWSKDTALTAKVNKYADAVVEAGKVVTLKFSGDPEEPTGLWITKSLTVKDGGRIEGSGILILEQGVTVTGIDLFYIVRGEVKQFPDGIKSLWESGIITNPDDTGTFVYDEASKIWCLTGYSFDADPFFRGNNANNSSTSNMGIAMNSANGLSQLRLFKGVGTFADGTVNFDLGRPATRVEALVMLIRLLGKEAEAESGNWKHPFTDVPVWANEEVGYAYEKGLTKGSTATTFGTGNATSQMYLTFVLRALGYSDAAGGDFTWDRPEKLANELALINENIKLDNFLRADAALVSAAALCVRLKDSTLLLLDKLIDAGVFSGPEYNAAFPDSPVKRGDVQQGTPEYERDPVVLATGPRNFMFTLVNVDDMTGMTELYLSDGSYSGGDWQTTDKGWVKFDITNRGLKTEFSCYTDVDFENIPDLKIRYSKNSGTNTDYCGCTVKNGGRYFFEETAEHILTPR